MAARYEDDENAPAKEAREPLIDRVSMIEKRLRVLEESVDALRRMAEDTSKILGRELGL